MTHHFPSESQVVLSWRAAPNWRNAGPRRLPVKFVRFAGAKKNLEICRSQSLWLMVSSLKGAGTQKSNSGGFCHILPPGIFQEAEAEDGKVLAEIWRCWLRQDLYHGPPQRIFCSCKQHIPICSMIFHAFIFHPFQNWQEGTSRWGLFWWLGTLLPCHNYFQSRNETSIFFNPKEWTKLTM